MADLSAVVPHDATDTPSESACGRLIRRAFTPNEFSSLIEAILSSKEEDTTIRNLSLEDAQKFVDAIDEALNTPDLSPSAQKKSLRLLYRTCGHHAIVPSALKVPVDYDRTGDALYRGGYADVWKGECSGQDVAVKVIRLYSKDVLQKVINKFCKEAVTWKSLQHPNILPLIGVVMSETRFAMVSVWMENGNINEFIKAHPEADRLGLLVDTAEGLIYLHGNGMIHGDIKGLNILIDETHHARLADFGLLTIMSDPVHLISSSSHGQGGTIRWMGPELIAPEKFGLKKSRLTKSSDCYALGMVIYETISGNPPFYECIETAVYVKVLLGEHPSRGTMFPEDLWKMMEWCWTFQPDDRPSIADVLRCLRVDSNSSESTPQPGSGDYARRVLKLRENDDYTEDAHSGNEVVLPEHPSNIRPRSPTPDAGSRPLSRPPASRQQPPSPPPPVRPLSRAAHANFDSVPRSSTPVTSINSSRPTQAGPPPIHLEAPPPKNRTRKKSDPLVYPPDNWIPVADEKSFIEIPPHLISPSPKYSAPRYSTPVTSINPSQPTQVGPPPIHPEAPPPKNRARDKSDSLDYPPDNWIPVADDPHFEIERSLTPAREKKNRSWSTWKRNEVARMPKEPDPSYFSVELSENPLGLENMHISRQSKPQQKPFTTPWRWVPEDLPPSSGDEGEGDDESTPPNGHHRTSRDDPSPTQHHHIANYSSNRSYTPPSFQMHPLFAYSRLHHSALIQYDVSRTPSAQTVMDCTTHSPVPANTLAQAATDPPTAAPDQLLLGSHKFPWTIVVKAGSPYPSNKKTKHSGSRSPVTGTLITNLDVLYAIHTTLIAQVTSEEWEALGEGSTAERKVTRAYEKRCSVMGDWEGGVRRVDWLGGKTHLIGIEVDRISGHNIGKLVFARIS